MSTGPNLFKTLLMAGGFITPVVLGALLLKASIYKVDTGHMAVKFSRLTGMGSSTYREGYNIMIPWFERPVIYDVRSHPMDFKSSSGSKDL